MYFYLTRLIFILLTFFLINAHPISKKHKKRSKTDIKSHDKLHHIKRFFKRPNLNADDVTNEINSKYDKVNYFINSNELPLYEEQFKTIQNLGESIECKIRGVCTGSRREEIPDQQLQQQQQTENEEQKAIMEMAERQMHGRRPESGDNNQQMPDMNTAADNPEGNPYGKQSDAAMYGQQPQMDIKLPNKDIANMQQGSNDGAHSEEGGQGRPNGPEESNTGALLRMQSQQNDETIQNSIQSKMNFMDKATKFQGASNDFNRNSDMDFPRNEQSPMSFAGHQQGKEDISGPHGMPNSDGSSVSDKDIMKAEGIAPNEMHDLHDFLKTSNELAPSRGQQREMMNDSPYPSNDEQQQHTVEREPSHEIDSFHDNPQQHHRRKFFNQDSENAAAAAPENFDKANPFGHEGEDGHERNPMSSFKARNKAMFKPQTPEVPTINNLLGGVPPPPMGNGAMSEDGPAMRELGGMRDPNSYVEQSAKQMMQSNSDYKLPGNSFTNLWKSFMLTTQSQLGEADPSANSREGMLGGGDKKNKETHDRWKKSNVDHAPLTSLTKVIKQKLSHIHLNKQLTSSLGKLKEHKTSAQLVYLPISVINSALNKASQAVGSKKSVKGKINETFAPEKEVHVKANNRQIPNFNGFTQNGKIPNFFVTEKDGKRYLVVNPNNNVRNDLPTGNRYFSFAFSQPSPSHSPTHFGPFGKTGVFDDSNQNAPLVGDGFRGKVLKGYIAVPILNNAYAMARNPEIRMAMSNVQPFPYSFNQMMPNQYLNNNNNLQQQYQETPTLAQPQQHDGLPNAFMYGPQYGQNADQVDSPFERISMKQPLLSGHFYRDPSYDPHVSETTFTETHAKNAFPHSRRTSLNAFLNLPRPIQVQDQKPMVVADNTRPVYNPFPAPMQGFDPRDDDLNRVISTEGGKFDHLNPLEFRERDMTTPYAAAPNVQNDVQQNFRGQEQYMSFPHPQMYSPNEQQQVPQYQLPADENNVETNFSDGNAPQPIPIESKSDDIKKGTLPSADDDKPFVFTKEHVGFGPITVEAKTANAPLNDPDDEK